MSSNIRKWFDGTQDELANRVFSDNIREVTPQRYKTLCDWQDKGKVCQSKAGTQPFKIIRAGKKKCQVRYTKRWSEDDFNDARIVSHNIIPYVGEQDETTATRNSASTEENDMLFEIKSDDGSARYGNKLAENSKGQWVMEEKGTGAILTVDKSRVSEVLPYSVRVRFVAEVRDRTYDYLAKEGQVNVGDLVFIKGTSGYAEVEAVDVKSRNATTELEGWVVSRIKIGMREDS